MSQVKVNIYLFFKSVTDIPLSLPQHSGFLSARLNSPGAGQGKPGAPETSSGFHCRGGGKWPGRCPRGARPFHAQFV